MHWQILLDNSAKKQLAKIPKKFVLLIQSAIIELEFNPYSGDIKKMKGEENVWRRRIGSYRMFFEVYESKKIVHIFSIERRTSSTY